MRLSGTVRGTGDNECVEIMRESVPGGEKHMNRGSLIGIGHVCADRSSRLLQQPQEKIMRT